MDIVFLVWTGIVSNEFIYLVLGQIFLFSIFAVWFDRFMI